MFACLGTESIRRPPRRRCCGTTARMLVMCGTWRSSSIPGGGPATPGRPATWSSAASSPPPAPNLRGCVRAASWSSNRHCGISPRPWPTSSADPPQAHVAQRTTATKASGSSHSSRSMSAGSAGRPARYGCRRQDGCGSAGPALPRRPGPTGSPETGLAAGTSHSPPSRRPFLHPALATVVGIDRGVVASAVLSTGELLRVPRLSLGRQRRLLRLQRRLARARRGSARRAQAKLAIAGLRAREADARKDWTEKTSTDLARRFRPDPDRRPSGGRHDPQCPGHASRAWAERPGLRPG